MNIYDNMVLSTLQKVSRSGKALIITIPVKIREVREIELGDYVEIGWGQVVKTEKKPQKKKKELPEL